MILGLQFNDPPRSFGGLKNVADILKIMTSWTSEYRIPA